MAFTEALTGQLWRNCGCADLRAVAGEFHEMRRAIDAKIARRATRDNGHARHEPEDDSDVALS